MFQEKMEEIEFYSNKRRNKFIKEVNEALENNKLSGKNYQELKELFK